MNCQKQDSAMSNTDLGVGRAHSGSSYQVQCSQPLEPTQSYRHTLQNVSMQIKILQTTKLHTFRIRIVTHRGSRRVDIRENVVSNGLNFVVGSNKAHEVHGFVPGDVAVGHLSSVVHGEDLVWDAFESQRSNVEATVGSSSIDPLSEETFAVLWPRIKRIDCEVEFELIASVKLWEGLS